MFVCFAALLFATAYSKLDYLPDEPLAHPTNITPSAITVCIDPGHGGVADGAVSCSGRLEKNINLLLASDLRRAFTNAGFRVVMTREDDRNVELSVRPAVAILNDCDLFISVHHNAPGPGQDPKTTRYASVYYWNSLGEGLADAIAGRWKCRSLQANFVVMRNPRIPSVLLEADFITHPLGERASLNPEVRRIRAAEVVNGVLNWLASSCK